jgi:predicted ester cyclase
MTGQADNERNLKVARRWFTEGWAGNIALADDIFSENVRTNGVAVGVAGPKRRIQERLAGFPDLSVEIEDMFSADDKIVTRLVWYGTHTCSYAGIKAAGKRVRVADFAIWRFKDGKVVEISTIQDQFALLKQVGYLRGQVYAA